MPSIRYGAANGNWRGGDVTTACVACGGVIVRSPAAISPRPFCNLRCYGVWRSTRRGPDSNSWKGGVTKNNGYRRVLSPEHPRAVNGYVAEHILVAEKALGKPLPGGVVVHHHNEIRDDNRNTNLVICQDARYHTLLHSRAATVRAGGDPSLEKFCPRCRCVRDKNKFSAHRQRVDGLDPVCKPCRATSQRNRRGNP